MLVPLRLAGSRQKVACQLFGKESIKGLIAIEGGDDVITIAPSVAMGDVFVEAVGVCITGHIEPVPAPSLTIRRRGQEAINQPIERVRTNVGNELLDLNHSWRETGQVERHPANERSHVGTLSTTSTNALCYGPPVNSREVGPAMAAVWRFVGSAGLGIGVGILLDRWLGTSPLWVLVGLGLGSTVGFYALYLAFAGPRK